MVDTCSAAKPLPEWQRALRDAISSPEELLRLLNLDPSLPQLTLLGQRSFPLRVPQSFVNRMRLEDPEDPLFRQVWPAAQESRSIPGFTRDPVGELRIQPDGGIIRKYRGRALVITTGACAIHCRYCFRRHFPYNTYMAKGGWSRTLNEIASDRTIKEVILSGGDPLTMDDSRLSTLVNKLESIAHLKRLRIHTRLPVVLPERVNNHLINWLSRSHLKIIVVLHINHAQEIDDAVANACRHLRNTGAQLLNQTVLLAGVNDSVDALQKLSERLSDVGVLPYYLHLMDKVQGAAHFEVDESRAKALVRALAACTSGYLVPKLVREVAGLPAKAGVRW